jgi:hypothetical protein
MLACRPGSTAGPPASPASRAFRPVITLLVVAGVSLLFRAIASPGAAQNPPPDLLTEYGTVVRPLVEKYCMGCHSTKLKKGSLDLERLASPAGPRKDLKVWQQMIEMVDAGDMPPKPKPQPAAAERKALITWVRGFLDAEARARAGDPGHVPLRRLSNAEYDYTIRDLTGVDLRPTREFPADGAAGEGFTNAAEALSEMSPALFTKYLSAAKDVSEHAVLLPDGFRFSPTRTRRDWTDESLARLRQFYAAYTADGKLPLQPYLTATVRHRAALAAGDTTLGDVAAKETLNARYLGVLWQTLTDKASSYPLSSIRARWRQASEKDVPALATEIAAWQTLLWKFVPIGSYRYGNTVRQLANDPVAAETQELKLTVKPSPGQSEVVLYLVVRDSSAGAARGRAVWYRPRFECAGKPPLLLRDYSRFGPAYEVDYPSLFADSSRYLSAAVEAANERSLSVLDIAQKHGLDAAFLKRWTKLLTVQPPSKSAKAGEFGRLVPAVPLELLDEQAPIIPPDSVLGRWREAATDPARRAEAAGLGKEVQTLLSGPRPARERDPDRILYDSLVSVDSALLHGLNLVRLGKTRPRTNMYGLEQERFGKNPAGKPAEEASLVVATNTVTKVRLPATLFRDRKFVVEGKLDASAKDQVVYFQVLTAPPAPDARWDGKSVVVASPTGASYKRLVQGYADFRRCFPQFICFPRILPDDEVVCLKMYHREDEALAQLFLDTDQKRRLDQLWEEHRFISQQPIAENAYLPQFIGFVTQDQPKELIAYFEGQREPFRKRAEAFAKEVEAAVPKQLDALLDFAARAWRRPLQEQEKRELLGLFRALRGKGVTHEEAFRGVLARVLASPAFLFRVEQAPPGIAPGPVSDWELATRLSYYLWSSVPDDELRRVAAAGQLRDPNVLAAQARRMLRDDRVRALAIEFGTQWIHVRGFDELKEKNEKLFPTFDASLRQAIYEESIRFFKDMFQGDRQVTQILDADYTFLNETLAKHYGIPGVRGPQWRRVEGVHKYGRGGILGLASVQASQSGASRTSPVLRGNWVVETLLGEKLPRPPANVPRLPEEEGRADGLTMRQQVENHTRVAACAVCHQRIDPFGFALEKYDPIGRRREKEFGGVMIDSRTKLKDGSEFDDIDGLRTYLLTRKKDVIVRLFCRRLVGYALGRAVTPADESTIDGMVAELNKNDGHVSAAVLAIVRIPQFRMVRGSAFASDE